MTDEDKKFLEGMFDAKSKSFLPTTLAGWLALLTSAAAVLAGIFFVFQFLGNVRSASGLPPRVSTLESKMAIALGHVGKEGVHQTPDQKRIATMLRMKPVEEALFKMNHRLDTVDTRLKTVQETLNNRGENR